MLAELEQKLWMIPVVLLFAVVYPGAVLKRLVAAIALGVEKCLGTVVL